MARKAKSFTAHEPGPKKRTSIGHSVRSRPKNKHKRRSFKKYRGQGNTDENPKDTVRIKFATPADARATVRKVKNIKKPFARKIQILTVMEQRAKVMGKNQVVNIAKKAKQSLRKKHGRQ